jgi:hypothetical protein
LGSINKNEQGLQKMLKTWLGQEIGQRKDESEHGVESPVMFETLEPRVLMNASPVGQVTPTPIASSTQPVVVQDVNGTQLTVSLSGHGSWQITQGPNGLQLTVTGTDANSQLTLTASTPGAAAGSKLNLPIRAVASPNQAGTSSRRRARWRVYP